MASLPIDPLLAEGLGATVRQHTGEANQALVDKLRNEFNQARSATQGPLPDRDNASGFIGGALGAALGLALGGGQGAAYGATGGIQGGLARAEQVDAERLDQYKKAIGDANSIIDDRMAIASKIGMLLQSGQGDVFRDVDPMLLGELLMPGQGQPLNVEATVGGKMDDYTKQELLNLRALLPYATPQLRMPIMNRMRELAGMPKELTVSSFDQLRPTDVQQAAQLQKTYINGAAIWMDAVSKGTSPDWSRGIERPERITTLDGLAISGFDKLDAYLKEQNQKGLYPGIDAAGPLAMSPSEWIAVKKATDGLDGRPTTSQMYRAWADIARQNAGLRAMGIDIGPDLVETVAKDMIDLYSALIIGNERVATNAHAERIRNKAQELYNDPKWANATAQQVMDEAVRLVNQELAGKGNLGEAKRTSTPKQQPVKGKQGQRAPRQIRADMPPEQKKAIRDYNRAKAQREEDKKK